jgi:glycerophosphoryl diester phosphodiesterase
MTRRLPAAIALAILTAAAASLTGCGSSDNAAQAADAAPPVAPNPSTFDCTSLPRLPERVAATPIACETDPSCRTRLVAAHRGGGGPMGRLAPENSLAGYRAAIVLGADFAETDPRPTADGVLVNVHDTTVDRTTNGTGEVSQMTLAEVQALGLDTGKYQGDFRCERIPTLREVLETCRGRIHVLVDANKTDRVDLLVGDIVATDTVEWAIFDTSSLAKIQQALAIEPSLQVMFRVDSVEQVDAGLAALAHHPPVIIEVNGGNLKTIAQAIHDRGHRVLTDVFSQDLAVSMSDDISLYEQPYSAGADIAQTDRPELVLRWLGRH